MIQLYVIGVVFFLLGVLEIVFRKPIGTASCRCGKAIWRNTPFSDQLMNRLRIESIYDEEKAPKRMLLMGIVSIIQGPLVILAGCLLRDYHQ